MWNLKNKTNEQANKNRFINTENKLLVARMEEGEGWAKSLKEIKKHHSW